MLRNKFFSIEQFEQLFVYLVFQLIKRKLATEEYTMFNTVSPPNKDLRFFSLMLFQKTQWYILVHSLHFSKSSLIMRESFEFLIKFPVLRTLIILLAPQRNL